MTFLASLEKRSKLFWIVVGFALIGGVGILNFLTGFEASLSFFYLIPISLITWLAGRQLGIVASLAGAIVWLITDEAVGNSYLQPFIYTWNTLIVLGFFLQSRSCCRH